MLCGPGCGDERFQSESLHYEKTGPGILLWMSGIPRGHGSIQLGIKMFNHGFRDHDLYLTLDSFGNCFRGVTGNFPPWCVLHMRTTFRALLLNLQEACRLE